MLTKDKGIIMPDIEKKNNTQVKETNLNPAQKCFLELLKELDLLEIFKAQH